MRHRIRPTVFLVCLALLAGAALAAPVIRGGQYILPSRGMKQAIEEILSDHLARLNTLEANDAANQAAIAQNAANIATNAADIATNAADISNLEDYAVRSYGGFVSGDGSPQFLSSPNMTVTRNGPGDYTIDFAPGSFTNVDGSSVAAPVPAFTPVENVYTQTVFLVWGGDGSASVDVIFRDDAFTATDTIFGFIVSADARP
ncbi:MAG: hypothetical protein ACYTG6_05515 [Planctomycetota bacterium]